MLDPIGDRKTDNIVRDADGRMIGVVDSISGSPLPLLRVVGWTTESTLPMHLRTSTSAAVAPHHACRLARPDVVAAGIATDLYCGFRAEFFLAAGETPIGLNVADGGTIEIPDADRFGTVRPHYESLYLESQVLRRGDIYGFGPPTDSTSEHKSLLARIGGDVLDFGCGNGDSLLALRARGCNALGVELDSPRIHGALKAEAREFTTLYKGGVPLPFADQSFDWVASIEVIEHIDDIEAYVPELARLLRPGGRIFLTTPDMTSIPSSYPTGTVPWHLLESTHVRFFTPTSLKKMLESHFELETAYSVGDNNINGWLIPGSIAAVFIKK